MNPKTKSRIKNPDQVFKELSDLYELNKQIQQFTIKEPSMYWDFYYKLSDFADEQSTAWLMLKGKKGVYAHFKDGNCLYVGRCFDKHGNGIAGRIWAEAVGKANSRAVTEMLDAIGRDQTHRIETRVRVLETEAETRNVEREYADQLQPDFGYRHG